MIKRYLLLAIVALSLVASASGLALDFQNPSDFTAHIYCSGTCTWTQNTSGGNNYLSPLSSNAFFSNTPLPMTYAAFSTTDQYTTTGWLIYFKDGSGTSMGAVGLGTTGTNHPTNRLEVKMVGGSPINATIYVNGELRGYLDGLTQYPSYIGFSPSLFDDVVWGTTSPRYVFGMPQEGYFIMKDVLNPAASGFYRVNQTDPTGAPTLIYSTLFPSTFSKPNGDPQLVTLTSPSGGYGLSYNTTNLWAGTIYWNLTEFFSQSTTRYGLYRTDINPQDDSPSFATSAWLPYIGSGASIEFDKGSYAVGETATLTATISDSYYSAITSPHVVIQDIFGTEVQDDTSITFTQGMDGDWVGTSTYTWTDGNADGVYFGLIYGTYGGEDVLMNYDTADVSSNLIVSGYVKDAETTSFISGAMVNVTQGSTTDALTSSVVDGNYTSVSTFSADAGTTIVASKSGYETYQHVFTPLSAGSIQINITLMPTSPTFTGVALGGIARSPPFNRTIDSATITISNTSAGTLTATTNSAGYYIVNDMPNNYIWSIVGTKSGFSTSETYLKLVVGS